MGSVSIATWIGNAAAVLCGPWGAVSRRAHEIACSRQAMDKQAQRIEQAVARAQAGGPSYEELEAENQCLRAENAALWETLAESEERSAAKQQEFAATGSAMGLSLHQIVTLLAIVLPRCHVPSRAKVGRWVEQASSRAGGMLAVLDRVCQAVGLLLCLEEMFFHQEPVLVAVEPQSMAWVAGQRGPDRPGETWWALWQTWPHVERVVCDAGVGLQRGVKLLNAARQEAAAASVQVNLDVFHTQRELQRVVHGAWRRAEGR